MIRKKEIKRAFSRAAASYDESAGLQNEVCDELSAMVLAVLAGAVLAGSGVCVTCGPASHDTLGHKGLRILDLGSGTGRLGAGVGKIFPFSSVIACDMALPMLTKAKARGIKSAVCADIANLPFVDGSFDAIISNLAYQWADNLEGAFKEAGRVLSAGGHLIFSTLGPATLHELRESFGEEGRMKFSSPDELRTALKAAGFEIITLERRTRQRVYRNLFHLLKALKGVGALYPSSANGLGGRGRIEKAVEVYGEKFSAPDNAGIIATYDVILVVARRV